MKKIALILALVIAPFILKAQDNSEAEKINKWIQSYNELVANKDWSSILSQQGKTKAELPEWDLVYYYVGFADYNLKNYQDAVMNFSIFLDKNSTMTDEKKDMIKSSLLSRAESFAQIKDIPSSIKDYDKYLSLSPGDVQAMLSKANVYLNANDFEGYIKELTNVINIEPSNKTYISNRAGAYANIGQWAMAIEDYSKLIQLDPNNKDFYSNRAFANYSLKTPEGYQAAVADYNKIVEMGFADEQTYNSLTVLNNALKNYTASIAAFDKLLELKGGEDAGILYDRGTAKYNNKDYKGAIEDFNKVLEANPEHINALKRRATSKTRLGDKAGAQQDAIKIKELEGK